MTPGPRKDNLDQPNRDPSATQDALLSHELDAKTIPPPNTIPMGQESVHATGNTLPAPLEAFMEPPTQTERDSTSTPTDDHELGSPEMSGHTADGSDKGMLKKDCTRTNKPLPPQEGRPMTAPLPYGALDQSTFLTDTEEWPQLPRQGGQDLHGPSQ